MLTLTHIAGPGSEPLLLLPVCAEGGHEGRATAGEVSTSLHFSLSLSHTHTQTHTYTPQDRVQNLYFSYLFVLRAVMKAGPLLERFAYVAGDEEEDARAAELIRRLVGGALMGERRGGRGEPSATHSKASPPKQTNER
jgi:hypothetical protein